MSGPAHHVCLDCGAEYAGHAEYCNACGSDRFERVGGSAPVPPRLRGDGTVLIVQGTLWLVAIVYLLGERSARHPIDVFWAWLLTAAASFVTGLVTRHLRAAGVFIGLGAAFSALAVLVRA